MTIIHRGTGNTRSRQALAGHGDADIRCTKFEWLWRYIGTSYRISPFVRVFGTFLFLVPFPSLRTKSFAPPRQDGDS